ncbi:hypothetical protein ACQPW3_32815 [Actinosynnema sp. CA-248983]
MARWVWPTAAGVVTSATGVVINVATDRADSVLAWAGVVLLTALGVGIGIAAQRSDLRHRGVVQPAPEHVPTPVQPIEPEPAAAPPQPVQQQPVQQQPVQQQPVQQRPVQQQPVQEQPVVPRSVHNVHKGNTVGPVIQVGYVHGNVNHGNSVNQTATAHDGGTVHQAGRDVRLDQDR